MFNTNLSIINTVIKSNENRYKLLVKRIKDLLNNKLKNKKITFLGVTFKAETDDMRESPALSIIPLLKKSGAKINYYEPTGKKDELNIKNVSYKSNIKDACSNSDLLIIHTEWNEFKQLNFKKLIKKKNYKIYDMRNLYSPTNMKKLNINYYGIGR